MRSFFICCLLVAVREVLLLCRQFARINPNTHTAYRHQLIQGVIFLVNQTKRPLKIFHAIRCHLSRIHGYLCVSSPQKRPR